jgi:hypothetical protein
VRWILFASLLALPVRANELRSDTSIPTGFSGQRSAEAGHFLPFTLAARSGSQKVVVTAVSGYDSMRGPVLRAGTEVHPWGPFVMQAGAVYGGTTGLQPRVGLRVQALSQERHHLDLAIGLQYDGASYEGKPGFEGFIAVARRLGRVGLFANFVYGQELEPSQRHGDIRVALLVRAVDTLQVGLDARTGFDLDSGREELQDEALDVDFAADIGPTLSWSVKWFSLIAHGGPSVMRYKNGPTRVGWMAVGGFGVTLF